MKDDFQVYDPGDKHVSVAIGAVVVSILVHVGFVFFMGKNPITFTKIDTLSIEQKLVLLSESSTKVRRFEHDPQKADFADSATEHRPDNIKLEEIFTSVPTDTPAVVFEPPPVFTESAVDLAAPIHEPAVTDSIEHVAPWQPREEIVQILDRVVYADTPQFERREVPQIERTFFAPDVTVAYELGPALRNAERVGTPAYVTPAPPKVEEAPNTQEMLTGGDKNMPDAVEAGPIASGEGASTVLMEVPADVAPAKPIEDVLTTSLLVHRPKKPDGYVYFRVDVARKGEDVLPVLPRNILLVQDASASLAKERLHYCRQAFKDIIGELKPTDRFNILTFNTQNTLCFGNTWRDAGDANKRIAEEFVDNIRSEGNTDIFNAVKGVLDLPREDGRTTLILLVSDGKPTAGNIRRDSQIIGEFSKLNSGSVSVFAIGISRASNDYLLSMLSFNNRGGYALNAQDRFAIPKTVSAMSRGIANPVLGDIRFIFDSESGAEVSPAMTTHLYLDRPMQLFGRVPESTDDVVFQARGEAYGKKYDMVFTLNLASNTATPGQNQQLVTDWANARMYDCVAEYIGTGDNRIFAKMLMLGKQYGVTIPFKDKLY